MEKLVHLWQDETQSSICGKLAYLLLWVLTIYTIFALDQTLIHLAKSWLRLSVGKPTDGPGQRLLGPLGSLHLPAFVLATSRHETVPDQKVPRDQGGSPTVPSSSLLISLVYRARDCRCTVLVAGTRSLAVVGTRPGARNWLARAFSEAEVCRRGKRGHQRDRSWAGERDEG